MHSRHIHSPLEIKGMLAWRECGLTSYLAAKGRPDAGRVKAREYDEEMKERGRVVMAKRRSRALYYMVRGELRDRCERHGVRYANPSLKTAKSTHRSLPAQRTPADAESRELFRCGSDRACSGTSLF